MILRVTQNGLKQRNTYAVISILGFYTLEDGDNNNNLNMQKHEGVLPFSWDWFIRYAWYYILGTLKIRPLYKNFYWQK